MRYKSATNKNAVSVALLAEAYAVLFKCVLDTDVLNKREQCNIKVYRRLYCSVTE